MQVVVGKDALIQASLPIGLGQTEQVRAFCGIADPEKFWSTLAGLVLKVQERLGFPDHHSFTEDNLATLRAWTRQGPVVTTEKDWVRLPRDLRDQVHFVPYAVEFADPEALLRAIGQGQ